MSQLSPSYFETVDFCPICNGHGHILYKNLRDRLIPSHDEPWCLHQCATCGHVWLSPRLISQSIHLAYEGYSDKIWTLDNKLSHSKWKLFLKRAYFAAAYGYTSGVRNWQRLFGYSVFFHAMLRERLDRQVRFLSARERGKLLDLGSGNGWFLQNMQSLGWNVEGVDIDPVTAKKARDRNLTIRLGTLEEQNYPDCYFDAITLVHVIEHLHNPVMTLHECSRILRSGGVLVVITPNIGSMGHRCFREYWQPLEIPRHLNLFSLSSIRQAAQQADFRIESLRSSSYPAGGVWLRSRAIRSEGFYSSKPRPNFWGGMIALCAALAERVFTWFDETAGEEILLICRK